MDCILFSQSHFLQHRLLHDDIWKSLPDTCSKLLSRTPSLILYTQFMVLIWHHAHLSKPPTLLSQDFGLLTGPRASVSEIDDFWRMFFQEG